MEDWSELSIDDVCILITDGAHASPASVDLGKPMASVKDLTRFGITIDTCRHISEEDFQRLVDQGCKPEAGDVLISKDGAKMVETVCEIENPIDVVLLSSIAILRPNQETVLPSFLRYYFDSPRTRDYLKKGFVTGAAIPRVILEDFKRAKIFLPPIATQAKIVGFLSVYDKLIENSNLRIKILEEMAHMIYREWFVHFRFPGHESVKMVDSPLGFIPEGWSAAPFLQIADFINGYAFGPQHWGTNGKPIVKIAELKDGITDKTPFYDGEIQRKYHIENGDILFSWSGDLDVYIWGHGEALLNQHLFNVIPLKGYSKEFLYFALREKMQEFRNRSLGTTMRHIKRRELNLVQSVAPPKDVLDQFGLLICPITQLVIILKETTSLLIRSRDLLLPKLISGELDVEDLDITVGEEA